MALIAWSTDNLIAWIQKNLSEQYHQCIKIIHEHDIDGKLLYECLNDKDAKRSLLQTLFPDADDAFLRLSFMRKIEKYHGNKSNDMHQETNDIHSSNVCIYCGVTISSLLIENHQRHCSKQSQSPQKPYNEEKNAEQQQTQEVIAQIEENITVLCEFCEIEFNISLIDEHILYCGSRTEICHQCGSRDTLFKFKHNGHKCYDIQQQQQQQQQQSNNDPITFNNDPLDINNNDNDVWISSFERHLYDLEKILHDRFVVDYNNTSSHFQHYDSFGNNKKALYQQKANENISKIRTYNLSKHDVSNESRHKFEKCAIYGRKTKDELRKEYDEKFKMILNLLSKILENILNEPLNKRFRTLKCNNKKLKSLILSYSPCCEFIKSCGFVYIAEKGCYRLSEANNAKLKIAIGVLKYVFESFEQKATKQDYEQDKWELNQAYIKNDKSLFHGSWSCKKCNHLNRKTSICKKCKTKKKHSLMKEKQKRKDIPLSVERWICGVCGNRNAVELKKCDNCKKDKIIAPKQLKQYHQKVIYNVDGNNANDNNDNTDDLYLHHDEWM